MREGVGEKEVEFKKKHNATVEEVGVWLNPTTKTKTRKKIYI